MMHPSQKIILKRIGDLKKFLNLFMVILLVRFWWSYVGCMSNTNSFTCYLLTLVYFLQIWFLRIFSCFFHCVVIILICYYNKDTIIHPKRWKYYMYCIVFVLWRIFLSLMTLVHGICYISHYTYQTLVLNPPACFQVFTYFFNKNFSLCRFKFFWYLCLCKSDNI